MRQRTQIWPSVKLEMTGRRYIVVRSSRVSLIHLGILRPDAAIRSRRFGGARRTLSFRKINRKTRASKTRVAAESTSPNTAHASSQVASWCHGVLTVWPMAFTVYPSPKAEMMYSQQSTQDGRKPPRLSSTTSHALYSHTACSENRSFFKTPYSSSTNSTPRIIRSVVRRPSCRHTNELTQGLWESIPVQENAGIMA